MDTRGVRKTWSLLVLVSVNVLPLPPHGNQRYPCRRDSKQQLASYPELGKRCHRKRKNYCRSANLKPEFVYHFFSPLSTCFLSFSKSPPRVLSPYGIECKSYHHDCKDSMPKSSSGEIGNEYDEDSKNNRFGDFNAEPKP